MNQLAPIVLFVYNRPWHTLQTLKSLSENELADKSNLIIFADGPQNDASKDELEKIDEVRSIIRLKSWCKTVEIKESKINKGLANSIIEGVTEIINLHGKIIVLEDDIETSSGFLRFMNDALSIYAYDEKVMHVSGYMFPVKRKLPPTIFLKQSHCWGWATWKSAWDLINTNENELIEAINNNHLLNDFNLQGGYDFMKQLVDNANGNIRTWAVKWYASIFLLNGLVLHPSVSFVKNIGNDSSGVNSWKSSKYDIISLNSYFKQDKIPVLLSKKAENELIRFHTNQYDKTVIKILKILYNAFK